MERQEALERLQAAFPEAESADVSFDHDQVWFLISEGRGRFGVAYPSYDKVDEAITLIRRMGQPLRD